MFQAHRDNLAELAREHRLRGLALPHGHDFSSNDYLGLGASGLLADAIRDGIAQGIAAGSGGSRLLRGHHPAHEQLEALAANLFGSEAALFLPTGFTANQILYSTLPRTGDLIVYDRLIHASVHEGIRLSRAEAKRAGHNQPDHFDALIRQWRNKGGTGQIWIGIESLYSMDGDTAPMADFIALANRHDAVLIVDEAHATGVWGTGGLGLLGDVERGGNVISLHTLGKALGCDGALICGPAIVKDWLINHARPFIFSTAPSPLMAHVGSTALTIMRDRPDLRDALHARIARAHDLLPEQFLLPGSHSQIIPAIIGDNGRTMHLAALLQEAGFDVRGIRPPTVPPGTSRLRITITNNVAEATIDALFAVLAEAMDQAT